VTNERIVFAVGSSRGSSYTAHTLDSPTPFQWTGNPQFFLLFRLIVLLYIVLAIFHATAPRFAEIKIYIAPVFREVSGSPLFLEPVDASVTTPMGISIGSAVLQRSLSRPTDTQTQTHHATSYATIGHIHTRHARRATENNIVICRKRRHLTRVAVFYRQSLDVALALSR